MVKRRKEDDIAGVLEFAGRTDKDPEFLEWMADHKARNGGKLRIGLGGKGVRVMFTKHADMEFWRVRSEQALRAKKPVATP
jgi:erythromycin esterase-like protein